MAIDYRTGFAGIAYPYVGVRAAAGPIWPGVMPGGFGPGMMSGGFGPGMMPGSFPGMPYGPAYTAAPFVPSWPQVNPIPTPLMPPLDDEAIKELVYDAIDTDPTILPELDIDVTVSAGVVTLSGSVPGKRTKHAVGDAAWWIPGVVDVNNQLRVSAKRERQRARTSATRAA